MAQIVPSLLSADFSKLEKEIRSVERGGAKRLHLDIMDGHFVPNISFGPIIVKAIRKLTSLHLESHLMIENPDKYIDRFIEAGSDTVIVHYENSKNIKKDLNRIRQAGKKAGLVINPETSFTNIESYMNCMDHFLVMTVNPGFGGQKMIEECLDKVKSAKPYAQKYGFPIEIDGGVNTETVIDAVRAGTDLIVAGSAVFYNENAEKAFTELSMRSII